MIAIAEPALNDLLLSFNFQNQYSQTLEFQEALEKHRRGGVDGHMVTVLDEYQVMTVTGLPGKKTMTYYRMCEARETAELVCDMIKKFTCDSTLISYVFHRDKVVYVAK